MMTPGVTYSDCYNLALSEIADRGFNRAGTKLMTNVTIEQHYPFYAAANDYLFLPAHRGSMPASYAYAITESFWYAMATRDPSVIIPRASMWSSMTDDDGNVQSNYGYQLWRNNDLPGFAAHIIDEFTATGKASAALMIASPTNVTITSDTVCNNAVIVNVERLASDPSIKSGAWFWPDSAARLQRGSTRITVTSIARSIDMMHGYPYDSFTLQGIGHCVAQLLRSHCANVTGPVYVGKTSIIAANAHIYHSMLANVLPLGKRDAITEADQQLLAVPAHCTGYKLERYRTEPFSFNGTVNEQQSIARREMMYASCDVGGRLDDAGPGLQRITDTERVSGMFTDEQLSAASNGDRKQFKLVMDGDTVQSLVYLVPTVGGAAALEYSFSGMNVFNSYKADRAIGGSHE